MQLHERPHGAIVVDVRMPVEGESGARIALAIAVKGWCSQGARRSC
jgi:hypothetical protein